MSSPPSAPLRYVITNQKGGQAKTSTAINLGASLTALGYVVRIWDCDPQIGSATFWLPPQWEHIPADLRKDLYHVLMENTPGDEATWPTTVEGLYIVPSFRTAGQFERDRPPGADLVLRMAIEASKPYDVEIVDCPPNLGLLTVTAITAADDVVIPCRPGGLDMAGVADLNQTLALVRARLNPALRVAAVIVCDKPARSILADEVERQLREDYPDAVHASIRHTVRVGEAPFRHLPLREYAPAATATKDYEKLAGLLSPAARRAA